MAGICRPHLCEKRQRAVHEPAATAARRVEVVQVHEADVGALQRWPHRRQACQVGLLAVDYRSD